MDIEEHLAYHDPAIRAWVWKHIGKQGEVNQDAYQNIRLAMIEYHAGGYDHSKGELLTVLWPYLQGIAFRGYKDEYVYGVKHDLDMLQEIAEKAHGRYKKRKDDYHDDNNKIHLDTLYESPIPGLKTPRESTLSPEEQKLAERLMEGLTDEDREILLASYDLSERAAAAMLGMPKTTYHDRLAQAKERATVLLRLLDR
jgi:RNA polymerase sigma factor (sigma-70 family)